MWTEERVELLKKLWAEGLSASQVAKQLGEVTRNAVIGKVHRLGLSGRATPSRASRPRTTAQRPHPRMRPEQLTRQKMAEDSDTIGVPARMPESARDILPETGETATVLTLTEHTCKWPIGDPGMPDFHFCGRRSDAAAPYCVDHARLAYQPMQSRRNRTTRKSFAG